MKIYSLIENIASSNKYLAEHGLSLYIETKAHKILFDFGQTDAFVENATSLGVDLGQIDIAILSHGHYDHGGGLARFLELNNHARIYLNEHVFDQYYHGTDKYIGLNQELKNNPRLIFTKDYLKIDHELEIYTCNDKETTYPLDSANLTINKNNTFVPDRFIHEHYLVIHDHGKKIVIGGCLHKGVCNIINWLTPDILIGGFHFKKQKIINNYNPVLDQAGKILAKSNTIYYTCHCTGIIQYQYLKKYLGDKLHYLASGQIITL